MMRMFIGAIIEESVFDTIVLAGLPVIAERVSKMPTDSDATVWHVRWYRVEESALRIRLPELSKAMRPRWYAHFWEGDDLCVILAGKAFWAKISDRSSHAEFLDYGDTVGVERKWTKTVPTTIPDWVRRAMTKASPPSTSPSEYA